MESNLEAQFQKYIFEEINKTYDELLKSNIHNTNNTVKELEIEIKCLEKQINDLSIELSTFDKNKFYEFFNKDVEYLKNSSFFFSISLELKDEKNLELIKFIFDLLKAQLTNNPNITLKNPQILFRINGKKVIYDIFSNSPQDNLDKIAIFKPFHLIFKSKFNFNKNAEYSKDDLNILFDLCSIFFSLKLKYDNIFVLSIVLAFVNIMNNFIGNDFKEKIANYLNMFKMMITSLDKTELKFEFDNKDLSKIILNEKKIKNKIKEFIKSTFKFLKEYNNVVNKIRKNIFKGISKEYLSVTFGYPQKEFGFNLSMKIPGLNIVDQK